MSPEGRIYKFSDMRDCEDRGKVKETERECKKGCYSTVCIVIQYIFLGVLQYMLIKYDTPAAVYVQKRCFPPDTDMMKNIRVNQQRKGHSTLSQCPVLSSIT